MTYQQRLERAEQRAQEHPDSEALQQRLVRARSALARHVEDVADMTVTIAAYPDPERVGLPPYLMPTVDGDSFDLMKLQWQNRRIMRLFAFATESELADDFLAGRIRYAFRNDSGVLLERPERETPASPNGSFVALVPNAGLDPAIVARLTGWRRLHWVYRCFPPARERFEIVAWSVALHRSFRPDTRRWAARLLRGNPGLPWSLWYEVMSHVVFERSALFYQAPPTNEALLRLP